VLPVKETKTSSLSSCLSRAKGYGLELGCVLELGFGLLGGLQRGLSGQVRQVSLLFYIFFFFSFLFYNSILYLLFGFIFEFNTVCK
jgi:hypothetical protein